MFDGADYHTEVAAMIKGTNEVFSDKFSIHFFELKKVGKKPNPTNRRELWLQFINADSEEEFNMLEQTNVPIMQKAVRVIYDMSDDTRVKEIARLREKALHDEASALKNAKEEGEAIGEKRGRAEERALAQARENNAIQKMRELGLSEEQIRAIYSDLQ